MSMKLTTKGTVPAWLWRSTACLPPNLEAGLWFSLRPKQCKTSQRNYLGHLGAGEISQATANQPLFCFVRRNGCYYQDAFPEKRWKLCFILTTFPSQWIFLWIRAQGMLRQIFKVWRIFIDLKIWKMKSRMYSSLNSATVELVQLNCTCCSWTVGAAGFP